MAGQRASYDIVAEMNKHEYDSGCRWTLKHLPDSPLGMFLAKKEAGRSSPEELRKDLHRRSRSGMGQYGAVRSSPMETSGGGSYLPALALASNQATSPALSGASTKTIHCRRKHRKDCPKHVLNNLVASGGVSASSSGAPTDPCTESSGGIKWPTNRVGRGLANFVGGAFVPAYNVSDSKSHRDHPDYAAEERAKLERVAQRQEGGFSPCRDALSPLLDESRVAETKDYRNHRQKYELKSHIEAMKMLGDAMLRKLSGAAFK
jgi:hypothetical protein